ncbi:MAG: carboxylesterase family protein, partial [Candidatus Poribacteria bacterium]|nr:carboxylesterase family protein [Candidatus Poribacteria bacterium]
MNRNQTFSLKSLLAIPLLTFILSGCGGGGGSGGGGAGSANTPVTFPEVLEFNVPISVKNLTYETSADSGRLGGTLRSSPTSPKLDCDDDANFNPSTIAQLRWVNEANDQSGETSIWGSCRFDGLFGRVTKTVWLILSIPLELGDNEITLTTFVDGNQIGEDTFTIIRDGRATVSDQVTINQGTLQGVIEGNLSVFRGVAYAAAPVGDLRFKAPQSPPALSGVVDASTFAPVCIQPSNSGPVGEEDCLYLNIWAHNDASVRPVIVFLHGGNGGGVGG